jgi:SAM-dependent methyltransferase
MSRTFVEPTPTRISWEGRTGPFSLVLFPRVFPPSRTSRELADRIEVREGEVVVDLGCGSGVLGIVAARLGAGFVYGSDILPEAAACATENARLLGVGDRTAFRAGDMFEPLADVQADVVIGDVSGIPDEIAEVSGWFPGGHAGGPTGSEVPLAMIERVSDHLRPGGRMYLPTGTIQDEGRILAAARLIFGERNMERIGEREFPLPNVLAGSKAVVRMMSDGLLRLRQRGSRLFWRLAIWRCVRT